MASIITFEVSLHSCFCVCVLVFSSFGTALFALSLTQITLVSEPDDYWNMLIFIFVTIDLLIAPEALLQSFVTNSCWEARRPEHDKGRGWSDVSCPCILWDIAPPCFVAIASYKLQRSSKIGFSIAFHMAWIEFLFKPGLWCTINISPRKRRNPMKKGTFLTWERICVSAVKVFEYRILDSERIETICQVATEAVCSAGMPSNQVQVHVKCARHIHEARW